MPAMRRNRASRARSHSSPAAIVRGPLLWRRRAHPPARAPVSAMPRMRSRAEPALLPCRDAPPGQLVAGPAWRGSRAFRGPGASQEIANAVGRRVALAARRRAVGIDVQMLVDDRKQVRALLVDPVKCR